MQESSPVIRDFQSVEINPTQVNTESAALNTYFQAGFQGEVSDEEDEEPGDIDNDEDPHIVDNEKTHDALAWADKFILKTRRRGGRQTENSVLKQWKVRQNHKRFSPNPSHFIDLVMGIPGNQLGTTTRPYCRRKSYN